MACNRDIFTLLTYLLTHLHFDVENAWRHYSIPPPPICVYDMELQVTQEHLNFFLRMFRGLKSVLPKSRVLLCIFLGTKGLNENGIHNEMFSVYVGKWLSRNEVHNWVEKFSHGRSKVTDDSRPGAEVTETTKERLFLVLVSTYWYSNGTSVWMLVEDTSRNKCFFSCPGSNITCFTFYIHV
jgi:hypothetical protein